jgi:hypothetical protein
VMVKLMAMTSLVLITKDETETIFIGVVVAVLVRDLVWWSERDEQ